METTMTMTMPCLQRVAGVASRMQCLGVAFAGCLSGHLPVRCCNFRREKILCLNDCDLQAKDRSLLRRRSRLRELTIDTAVVDPAFFAEIACLKSLRKLMLRKVVINVNCIDLSVLSPLRELTMLELDACPRIHELTFAPLAELKNLEYLRMRVRSLDESQQLFIASCCPRKVSICLYGSQRGEILSTMSVINNLVDLEFWRFHSMKLPIFVSNLAQLTELSFTGGRIVDDRPHPHCIFPATLRKLTFVDCQMESATMNNLLTHGVALTSLRIQSDQVSSFEIDRCQNLLELSITTEFFSVDVLQRVCLLLQLEVFELRGCRSISRCHIQRLSQLPRLKKFLLKECVIAPNECVAFQSLTNLTHLSFDRCEGVNLMAIDYCNGGPRVHLADFQNI